MKIKQRNQKRNSAEKMKRCRKNKRAVENKAGDKVLRSMIAFALGQAFPDVNIHKEQTSQIDRPAFYIGEIKADQMGRIGNDYRRKHQMVVRYFPREDNLSDYEDLSIVADKLYACLEYLAYNGHKARAVQMNHRIEDNVLQFFFTVHFSLKRPEDHIKMEVLETHEYLKDEQQEKEN